VFEPADRIHRTGVKTRFDRQQVAAHVGANTVFHDDIGVVPGKTIDPARAVILKAATEQAEIIGPQRARQHISRKTEIAAAFESKLHGLVAINPFAFSRRQPSIH
jgi:hypothetical protein